MKVMKRIAALLLALLLLCLAALPGFAYEGIDMDKTGSVSLTMRYDGKAVGGGSFTVYRVGKVVDDDGNYSFALTDEFAGSGVKLTQTTIESADVAEELADYANEVAATGTKVKIVSDGRATAAKLELGLYLFVQTTAAKGYEAVHPFLVSVPMYETGTETYTYDVDATPKLSTIKKQKPSGDESSSTPTPTPKSKKDSKLPQTGQLNWPVPVLAALGLGLILCGWLLRSEKKTRYAD